MTKRLKEQLGNTGSTLGIIYKVKTCSFCGFSSEEKA